MNDWSDRNSWWNLAGDWDVSGGGKEFGKKGGGIGGKDGKGGSKLKAPPKIIPAKVGSDALPSHGEDGKATGSHDANISWWHGDEANSKEDVAPKEKRSMCKNWSKEGHCGYGAKCNFAHARSELIPEVARLEKFIEDNDLAENVAFRLRAEGPEVQRKVMDMGSLINVEHRSSVCMGRIRDCRLGLDEIAGPSNEEVEFFLAESGVDERAASLLRACGGPVQNEVIKQGTLITSTNPSSSLVKRIQTAKLMIRDAMKQGKSLAEVRGSDEPKPHPRVQEKLAAAQAAAQSKEFAVLATPGQPILHTPLANHTLVPVLPQHVVALGLPQQTLTWTPPDWSDPVVASQQAQTAAVWSAYAQAQAAAQAHTAQAAAWQAAYGQVGHTAYAQIGQATCAQPSQVATAYGQPNAIAQGTSGAVLYPTAAQQLGGRATALDAVPVASAPVALWATSPAVGAVVPFGDQQAAYAQISASQPVASMAGSQATNNTQVDNPSLRYAPY